jgi:hypothetical protein
MFELRGIRGPFKILNNAFGYKNSKELIIKIYLSEDTMQGDWRIEIHLYDVYENMIILLTIGIM